MKIKTLILLLIVSSLLGYLEWGENTIFLFQVEIEVIQKFIIKPSSIAHPFVLLPLIGQLLLVISFFQKTPNRSLISAGIVGIGILFLLMFFIALISTNIKTGLSTLPFLITSFLTLRYLRLLKKNA